MVKIADTGLLLGAVNRRDPHHEWARAEFAKHAPFVTCDAVLVELSFLLQSPVIAMQLVERGDVGLAFNLAGESGRVLELLERYEDRQMDLADACLVRMSELHPDAAVWTVDREDFQIYRRRGRLTIPCHFPPET
jgi:predicted nucleic acid-binding protein